MLQVIPGGGGGGKTWIPPGKVSDPQSQQHDHRCLNFLSSFHLCRRGFLHREVVLPLALKVRTWLTETGRWNLADGTKDGTKGQTRPRNAQCSLNLGSSLHRAASFPGCCCKCWYQGRCLSGSRLGHGEGNGTPLQYSCRENPMDGGAW